MSKRPRRNYAPAVYVALAAVNGDGTLAESAKRFAVHPAPVTAGKDQRLAGAADVVAEGGRRAEPPVAVQTQHAKIGALAWESVAGRSTTSPVPSRISISR